jgi:hypothetical protein
VLKNTLDNLLNPGQPRFHEMGQAAKSDAWQLLAHANDTHHHIRACPICLGAHPRAGQISAGMDSSSQLVADVAWFDPEFYALGVLGDSAFFDLLVLAISLQLQTIASRLWRHIFAGFSIIKRFMSWRIYVTSAMMLFLFADLISTVQKVVHRLSS